jgi:SWI/SNF-related matrix-associated actin-dependent regulator 1 of chromatin subfamily A
VRVFLFHINVIAQGTNYIRIDGRTTPDARKRMADIFQNDPSCQVAILSIMAANAGMTCYVLARVLFYFLCRWKAKAMAAASGYAKCIQIIFG